MADPVPKVHEEHPFVYHYTSRDGLKGILETQTLFATHYRFLNDTSEIEHMRTALTGNLQHFVKSWIGERYTGDEQQKKFLTQHGGEHIFAYKQAKWVVDRLYKLTFEGGPTEHPYAEPFITSFCSHSDDEDYERENGLLSQWRGYAGIRESGGFAIVFDTNTLTELLMREADVYYHTAGFVGVVVYDGDTDGFNREFGELLEKLREILGQVLSGERQTVTGLLVSFVTGVSRFKHRAFREEREFRIISSPVTPETYDYFKESDPNFNPRDRDFKEVFLRPGGRL